MVSIFDVAARAGVSSTTVSHALNGRRYVSPALVLRVHAAMKELDYVPSRSARNLATGRTRLIGLLVPDISNGFFAELTKSVERVLVDHRHNLVMGNSGWDRERELQYLEMIRSRAVDGIIYAAGATDPGPRLAELLGAVPAILLDEEVPDDRFPAVTSDNSDGGRQAAAHLLSLGHRRVLVIGAAQELPSSAHRVTGFLDEWIAGGGEVHAVEYRGFTEEDGRIAVRSHLASFQSGQPSCIFAANDLLAVGALDELRAAGLRVPDNVSVVGFDDSALARYSALTTVRQDIVELGRHAVTRLVHALDTDAPVAPGVDRLPVALVTRHSTAPFAP